MALAFKCSSHRGARWKLQSTRDRELREAKEKLTTTYRPALTEEQKPVIPAPKIFADLTCASSDLDNIPTTAQCAVHLEFLEKVVQLKQKVLTSNALDRAFRLVPADKLVTRKGKREVEADAKFKERQAVKWPVFVRIGAARFLKWWKACSAWLPIGDHAIILDEDILPPIDVLMVWHGFLLNPIKYGTFCKCQGQGKMLRVQFPWQHIHRSFVDDDPSMKLGAEATDFINMNVGEVDLFASLAHHKEHSESFLQALQSQISTGGAESLNVEFSGLRGNSISEDDWRSAHMLGTFVERQAAFAEKMDGYLWLRSPAIEGTLRRACIRYERFVLLFKKHPNTMLVPTPDIDLVWHTHQCSPSSYSTYCGQIAGRAINHDDTVKGNNLKKGFTTTSQLYALNFQEEYGVCLCWNCETIKSELGKHHNLNLEDSDAIVSRVQSEIMYHQAVEQARRKGKPLPARLGALAN